MWDRVFDPVVAPIAKGSSPGERRASACQAAALWAANGSETRLYASSLTASDCRLLSAIPLGGISSSIAACAAFGV